MIPEFVGIRSAYYIESMKEKPDARDEEQLLCLKHLKPQPGETILETGAGGGFFTEIIAEAIYPGQLIATDPSSEQLASINHLPNIQFITTGADTLTNSSPLLKENTFDAVWSGASFHHVPNKTAAFKNYYSLLKPGGRLVITDVFAGTKLAKHFDLEVAKYCATGHEVAFLTKEFADSLCYIAGFQKPTFYDGTIQWKFESKADIGIFLYKLHAMIKTTPERCLEHAEKILGVKYKDGLYRLNWPLTVLTTYKR
jgi:SAM-dependent methyltransferase